MTPVFGYVAIALAGVVLSGVYSGLETGLYTLNPVRLTVLAARGHAPAVRLRRQLRNQSRTLMVLLIGTNAASYLTTYAVAEVLHTTGMSDWKLIVIEAALVTPLLFIFAETLPKDLFRTHTDHWTYWLSPFVTFSRWLFTATLVLPCVRLVTGTVSRLLGARDQGPVPARQRISQLIREGVGAGVLSVSQVTLTDRALSLREKRVGQVMVPWVNAASLRRDADREAREALFRRRNFTRVPAVDERGRVVGVLSWVDAALNPARATADLLQPALTFPPRTGLLEALTRMRRQRQPMAVIVEPRTQRPIGLVTLKDLVEPLTGELGAW